MKGINKVIEYEGEDEVFNLEPLSDIHYDDINFDASKFNKAVERIRKDKTRFTILLGDYGSSIYGYTLEKRGTETIKTEYRDNPDTLYNDLVKCLSPIKGKIIGMIEGNHDYKISQLSYHKWVKELAADLGVPYLTYVALINLKFIHKPSGKVTNIKVYATHGSYCGAESSSAITKLKRLSSQIDADVYLMGDRHDIDFAKKVMLFIDDEGVIKEGTRILGLCGCFVRGYSLGENDAASFPERRMMYPNRVGTLTVRIEPFTGKLSVVA